MKISNKSGSSAEFQVGLGVATSTQRGAIGSIVRFLGAAAVDATVVALLTVAVVFAASSSSIASPKAWFYAGSGGYGNDLDTDGDGVPDSQDGCPTDPRKVAPGECGCGGFEEDVDGDGDVDCAVPSGTVRAWGRNDYGQTNVPSDLGASMSIAASRYHTVALRTDGTVRAWGYTGYGATNVPSDLGASMAIAAGEYHTVALRTDGTVRAWGYNSNGQTTVPSDLGASMAIAAGNYHTVALQTDGTVRAWGSNGQGQTNVPSDLGASMAIAAGSEHTVALRTDGTVRAWGYNGSGQTDVPSDLGAVMSIAAGGIHTVALRTDGTVRAWGYNGYGQTTVPSDLGASMAIAAGYYHTVALQTDGTVRAWGYNGSGQTDVPSDLGPSISIAAGYYHTVAIANPDCDANGIPDWRELSLNDIDRDGRLDVCEVEDGAVDCNGDQVSDEDQLPVLRERSISGQFAPAGQSRQFPVPAVREASPGTTVEISGVAYGDLSGSGEFLRIEVAGAAMELAGTKWGASASVTVSAAAFNEAIALNRGGSLPLRVTSGANVDSYNGDSFTVTLRYWSGTLTDCNLNGQPDSCDLSQGLQTDCDLNGVPDNCDVGASPTVETAYGQTCDGQTANFSAHVVTRAVLGSTVTVDVEARGDTDRGTAFGEFVEVRFGNRTVVHQGVACGGSGNYQVQMDAAEFNALIDANDDVALSITAGPDAECSQCQSWANVRFTFVGVDPANDCNINGRPDSCDADSDGDGIPNECDGSDLDSDGDGVLDAVDACPQVAGDAACNGCPRNVCGQCGTDGLVDTDGDTEYDCVDTDDDGDGVLDAVDACPQVAGDAACNGCPRNVCGQCGTDGLVDTDGDTEYDCVDTDDDGDGVLDAVDTCPQVAGDAACNGCPRNVCGQCGTDGLVDTNGDTEYDCVDTDDDGDGVVDALDAFPLDDGETVDTDGDGTGNNEDTDDDDDDADDATDGCPLDALKQLEGVCGCGVPDVDSDGDGVLDCLDGCPTDARKVAPGECGCGGFEEDVDGDGDVDCAVPSGQVRAWGLSNNGQAGVPSDLGASMSIAAGYEHTVALLTDGMVRAWGRPYEGQTNVPSDLGGASAIAAGDYHTVALQTDGTVRAWGYNNYGQTNVPSDLGASMSIAAGNYHTVALRTDGTVRAWGYSDYGQTNVPSDIGPVMAIAAGGYNTVALQTDGTVRAWGDNGTGQTNVPSDLGPAVAIAAGENHTVALRTDGTVRAWGRSYEGQTNVPSDLGPVMAIAAGSYNTVALQTDGTVRAWGYNGYGGTNVPSDLGAAMAIAAGGYHTVAIANPDCNANGIPDWRELSLNDIDRDGRLDVCEVEDGAADCNGDLVPDDDQLPVLRERSISGQFVPAGQSRQFPVPAVREASPGTTVEISGVANGDLSGSGEFLRIAVAGAEMELSGTKWGASASVTVSAAAFNEALALNRGSSLPLRVTSGPNVDSYNGDSLTVTLRYWSGTLTDCNLNGQPDSCDLSQGLQTDCDLNGVPDNCDVGASPTVETAYGQTCDGQTANFSAHVVTRAVLGSTVTVDVEARGDTDRGAAFGEFVEVRFGNRTVVHQGVACGESGNYQVQMDAAEFNALIDVNDDVALSITAGPDAECSQCQSTATVRFTFVAVDPANDCNINGLPDSCDISSGYSTDSDGDGIPNECDGPDLDSDGDGVIDAVDACPQVAGDAACNGCPRNVCGQCGTDGLVDTNGDTEYDCVDTDDDGDGVIDTLDAFPLDAGETVDTDGDGQGNNADTDDDQDGLDDGADNCPGTVNVDQADLDADGAGDACDLDDDNDGAVDTVDNCPTLPNPTQGDCDGNGIGDACDTASTSAGPDMVVNGGFEASEYNGTFVGDCFTSGGFTMAGWQHGATRTEDLYRNSDGGTCYATPPNPAGGQYLLSLQGSGCCNCDVNGAIWQELVTETDRTYTLRMQVFVDDFDAIRVSYGTQSATFSSANVAAEVWTEVTWQFNGVGQAAELRIQSVGSVTAPGCLEADNAFLDNVRVTRDAVVVDCNDNGQQDLLEIAAGTVADCNSNCVPDSCDQDADADGFIDACDPCPSKPGPDCNGCPENVCGDCGSPSDLDGDTIPDCVDPDDDGDDVPDGLDAFPTNAGESVDTDGDGIGNNADLDDDSDGIVDSMDNCVLIANPLQEDCNGNGNGDACELAADSSLDCNVNGTLDSCDISAGASDCDADGVLDSCELASGAGDCNGNGIPDSCDIAAYRLEDCNSNGVGDSCEKQLHLDLSSGIQAPLGFGFPKLWTLEKVVRAVDTVRVELTAKGDLSSMLEYVQVDFPQSSYRAFNDDEGDAPDCVVTSVGFEIPLELFNNSIAPDGSMRITLTPSAAVDRLFCGGDTWIEISVVYIGAASSDCNANGVLDSCEIAAGTQADSDGNGIPDECVDPILPCPADFDGNGFVNGADLSALLSDWGGSNPYYDVNRDGVINGADLAQLLSLWGLCSE